MNRTILLMLIATTGLACCFNSNVALAGDVDFARDVLPILSNKCFLCHGPDAKEDQLRLDSHEAATEDLGGYRAIDRAAPEKSAVLERIHSTDDPMPPDEAEKPLTASERKIISQWIHDGGQYAKHWAFVAPVKSTDHDGSSPKQIDGYIESQLKANQVDFAKPADKATLARRAAIVLTGLPPEPEQLKAFMSDPSDRAYERIVESLLNSPRFGEHQARYWLDAVRYGDTHGLHLDNRRGIYPYRDWVVNALNENLPLDDFISWQIAGDLLPDPTLGQRVATGFVRLNPSTGEGGAITQEFQAKNNFDRVENLGTVFLGMSLTCARCHNHKYDPITQSEYYELMAFFNSTAEPAMDGNSYTYGPTVRAPRNQTDWQDWKQLEARREGTLLAAGQELKSEKKLADVIQYASKRVNWKTANWQISKPLPTEDEIPAADPDGEKGNKKKRWAKANGLPGAISGRAARGKLPGVGQSVWITFDVNVPVDQNLLLTFSGGIGSSVTVDDAEKPSLLKEGDAKVKTSSMSLSEGKHSVRLKIIGVSGIDEIQVRIENPWDSLAKSKRWDTTPKRDRLLMLSDPSGPFADSRQSHSAAEVAEKIRDLESNFTTSLVAKELPKRRETKVLRRGEYDMPEGDALQPGVFGVMNPLPTGAPRDRAGLAAWLTSSDNPLVARVLVNRVWQRTFGHGLVRTPEDFGLQGQQPTHPELLDWLAVELQQSNWDLKHLLRLMVTSKTFRQSSSWRAEIDDPENKLFARGPSFRLDAEVLRDMGLWASGLLDPAMGGEGVKPYQPSGMWQAMAHPASNTKQYQRDSGQRLYRRSLYVYWKRTSPHPMMTLFDAPDRESSCVRRSRTSTALQSLAMFNETQRVEMGRKFAERLLRQRDSDAQRINMIFQLLACRDPNQTERDACVELLEKMKKRFNANPEDATELLKVGESPRDKTQNVADQAAWTQVAIAVLASDLSISLY